MAHFLIVQTEVLIYCRLRQPEQAHSEAYGNQAQYRNRNTPYRNRC